MIPLSRGMLVALLTVAITAQSADSPKSKTTYESKGNVLRDHVFCSIDGGSAVSAFDGHFLAVLQNGETIFSSPCHPIRN